MKLMRRLLLPLILLFAILRMPLAKADGSQPYWTFVTGARVIHVQAADINGDGMQEIGSGLLRPKTLLWYIVGAR